ncbi:kinase-like protein [Macrolepiota fuliginosa MF-IS2]|uniref:Kinase-like protein n=1 Tax=Macrolepiota fuliginosa MF-IS2 TaxID=1400762 RepID=A0A9P5XHN8_9AGAR|nr:kinase-like protein [Macrolepiota fuliginosa MF-IS2]
MKQSRTDAFYRSRILLSCVLADPTQEAFITSLRNLDAQCMADFLDKILREKDGILSTEEGSSILSLLCALTKSAQVFPQCYELKDIEEDPQIIAAGGFSEIRKGTYQGQTICLKVLRQYHQPDRNERMLGMVAKEFVLWAHLSHPNILPLYGVYYSGGSRHICLVCPWIKNGNLVEYLKSVPQSPRMPLICDVANGLLYLHQLMIVHGDLKGANVLVSNEGHALVSDFGLSSIIGSGILSQNEATGGATRWSAPELFYGGDGGGGVSSTWECDIWSFSCLCYEVHTLRPPFFQYARDIHVIVALQRQEIPILPDGCNISDRMWGLMNKCWRYNPRDRPSCEEIWRFLMDLEIIDPRPPAKQFDVGEVGRKTWDSRIDYPRVYDLLFHISQGEYTSHSISSYPE